MKNVTFLIVDDEAPGRINLEYAMRDYPDWSLVASCDSAESAAAVLARQDVDVVFLDIQMPVKTGLDLARVLCHAEEPPLIIFVTAYSNYAVEAFEAHALDYLLKPFDDSRLHAAVTRAKALLDQQQRRAYSGALRAYMNDQALDRPSPYLEQIGVRSVGRIDVVRVSDILWLAAAGNYVELHLSNRVILHRQPISQLESRLDPGQFIRVHRSTIVRVSEVAMLRVVSDGVYKLGLACGDSVVVSERYVAALRAQVAALRGDSFL